jgi:hypothetical protein
MLYPFLAVHRSLLPLHYAFPAMLHPLLPRLYPLLPRLRLFAAMLHAFAATPCEGEDAVHEESRGHHALHGMPDPFRERRSERVGCSSERATTGPASIGIPSPPFGMSTEAGEDHPLKRATCAPTPCAIFRANRRVRRSAWSARSPVPSWATSSARVGVFTKCS